MTSNQPSETAHEVYRRWADAPNDSLMGIVDEVNAPLVEAGMNAVAALNIINCRDHKVRTEAVDMLVSALALATPKGESA